ncbi:IS3 family transposase [bacterium]|nr:IS3 family transposase [bacterium]MBU1025974.1 IS3 family transposase [bacterium]
MVGPTVRKAAVKHLVDDFDRSERHSCRVVGISRTAIHYAPLLKADEANLRARIKALAHVHRRYGYRRVTGILHGEGWSVNVKRVHRIWKAEGLGLRAKRPKRRRYASTGEVIRKAEYRNHVWAWDFMQDRTEKGGVIKILNIVDEYTRQALAMRVAQRIDSRDIVDTFKVLMRANGCPDFIRSDNGPEFIAERVRRSLVDSECKSIYIKPGSPWENAYIESFNGKFRDECLNMNIFNSGREAMEIVNEWCHEYNELRPHSSLNYLTPNEFARRYGSSLRATPSGHCHTDSPGNPKL